MNYDCYLNYDYRLNYGYHLNYYTINYYTIMNEKTFNRLVDSLSSSDFSKVEDAANTICALRDSNAYPMILSALESGSPLVQRVMLWAMRNYEHSSYSQFLKYLMAEDDDVREAAQVLFMEGKDAACKALISVLSSAWAKAEPELEPEQEPELDSEPELDPELKLQYAVVETLGHFRSECAKTPLLASLSSSAPEIRELAIYSLSSYDSDDVTAALLSHLGDVTPVRVASLSALRGRPLSSDALLSVMPLLSDVDPTVRLGAVYVLDAVVPDSLAGDLDSRVRRAVAEVTESAEVLQRLCLDVDSSVRMAAADASGKRGVHMDEVLISLLQDENPGVRRAAATALSGSSGDVVVDALSLALKDPKPGIRAAAATSLGKIGGAKAKAALMDAAKVKNPILAGIIKNALSAIEEREAEE